MEGRRAFSKLMAFKLFVIVTTLQNASSPCEDARFARLTDFQFIFSILHSRVTGNSKVTYNDITIGLPALLICVEAMVFMIANHFVFNAKEYRNVKAEAGPTLGFARALLNALNPIDLIQGIGQAFGTHRT
jgi:hypothetical protein